MGQAWWLFLFLFNATRFFKFFLVSYAWFFLIVKFFVVIFNGSYWSNSVFSVLYVWTVVSLSFIFNIKEIFLFDHNFLFWIGIRRTFNILNNFLVFLLFNFNLINNNGIFFFKMLIISVFRPVGTLCYFYWFLQNL